MHKHYGLLEGQDSRFSKANKWVRTKILEEIVKHDVSVGEIVLKKWKVKPNLRKRLNVLYNYVVVHSIMLMIVPSLNSRDRLELNLDKCMSGFPAVAFSEYARDKLSYLWQVSLSRQTPIPYVTVIQARSENEPCIQAADFIAGTIFRKYEKQDNTYYSILEQNINISARILWP